ncbi:hypothetical protein ABZT47_28740 [Sphaerisporangium sp. NPDC005289]|uniref:hypothetical protein n=1 Tax=Sphaerisporangium sp. NPDC005289 TaxID=3155247 RepID=UPI0033AB5CD0
MDHPYDPESIPDDLTIDLTTVKTREELVEALAELRMLRSGGVSYRELEKRTRLKKVRISKSTASSVLKGQRLGTKEIIIALAVELGATEPELAAWGAAWARVAAAESRSAMPARPSEVAELRETIAELQLTVANQQRALEELSRTVARLSDSRRGGSGEVSSRAPVGGSFSRLNGPVEWTLQRHMQEATAVVARDTVQAIATDVAADSMIAMTLRRKMQEATAVVARDTVQAIATDVAADSGVRMIMERQLREFVPQAAQEVVRDIARKLA